MSLDLGQLRWQQIRTVEALHVAEAENVVLKVELGELKLKLVEEIASRKANDKAAALSVQNDLIQKHCLGFKSHIMKMQTLLLKVKFASVQDIANLAAQRDTLKLSFEKLAPILSSKDKTIDDLRKELLKQKEIAKNLQLSTTNASESSLRDIARLESKIRDLQLELMTTKNGQKELQNKLADTTDKLKHLQAEHISLEEDRDNLQRRTYQLQLDIQSITETNQAKEQTTHQQILTMQQKYEQLVEKLCYENEFLRATCMEQEAQIIKLTNSLVGNKSHFAKYVEVKTENLALQSKLESFSSTSKSNITSSFKNSSLKNNGNITSGPGSGVVELNSEANMLPAYKRKMKAMIAAANLEDNNHNNSNNNDSNSTTQQQNTNVDYGNNRFPPQKPTSVSNAQYNNEMNINGDSKFDNPRASPRKLSFGMPSSSAPGGENIEYSDDVIDPKHNTDVATKNKSNSAGFHPQPPWAPKDSSENFNSNNNPSSFPHKQQAKGEGKGNDNNTASSILQNYSRAQRASFNTFDPNSNNNAYVNNNTNTFISRSASTGSSQSSSNNIFPPQPQQQQQQQQQQPQQMVVAPGFRGTKQKHTGGNVVTFASGTGPQNVNNNNTTNNLHNQSVMTNTNRLFQGAGVGILNSNSNNTNNTSNTKVNFSSEQKARNKNQSSVGVAGINNSTTGGGTTRSMKFQKDPLNNVNGNQKASHLMPTVPAVLNPDTRNFLKDRMLI